MKNLEKYKTILWDFDGVLLDSMPVREYGFRTVLRGYPENQVEQLVQFHQANGGLSRYVKFRYFFEEIRKEEISEAQVLALSQDFSELMKERLISKSLLISDSVEFVKSAHSKKVMHIVSGSDEKELRYLCEILGLSSYFLSINGSPTPKNKLVATLISGLSLTEKEVLLIGDSLNDAEAARVNEIDFAGYNNLSLTNEGVFYIRSFSNEFVTFD